MRRGKKKTPPAESAAPRDDERITGHILTPEDKARDAERRMLALAEALAEKIEENTSLLMKLEGAHNSCRSLQQDAEARDKHIAELEAEKTRLEKQHQLAMEQGNSRAMKLETALNALSAENQVLAKKRGKKDYAVPENPSELEMMFSGKGPKDLENAQLKKRLEDLEAALAQQRELYEQLELKLEEETAQKEAYIESNQLYENKLKEMEERKKVDLEKEAERRKMAEAGEKSMRDKVKNLRFLLSEFQGDDDNDDDDDDDESDDSDEDDDEEEDEEDEEDEEKKEGGDDDDSDSDEEEEEEKEKMKEDGKQDEKGDGDGNE